MQQLFALPLPIVRGTQFDFQFTVSDNGALIAEASTLQANGFNHIPLTVEWPDGHQETFSKNGALPDRLNSDGELEVFFLRGDNGTVMHILND